MNYFIQGNAANAERIKAAFEAKAIYNGSNLNFTKEDRLFYSCDGKVNYCSYSGGLANIIKTHPDYQELVLPLIIELKFKVGDTIRDIVNNENRTYMIIGINYDTQHYLVNGGSISFFVQDTYEVVETDDKIWLREACDYLYKHLFTKADGAEHYVVSCQKITQTEFVQYFRNHMKEVMK